MRKASRTFSIWECTAEPLVENESRATRGSVSRKARAFSAVARAISASSCAVGSGTTAQSAKSSAPFSPKAARLRSGANIKKKLDTTRASGAKPVRMQRRPNGIEGEILSPADSRVGITRRDTKRSEIKRLACKFLSFFVGDSARVPALQIDFCGRAYQ